MDQAGSLLVYAGRCDQVNKQSAISYITGQQMRDFGEERVEARGRSVGGEPRRSLDAGRQLGRAPGAGAAETSHALDLADLGLSAESVRSVQWDHRTPNIT